MKTPAYPVPPAEVERVRLARKAFDTTMATDPVTVEMHLVVRGDAIECFDGEWRPALASFSESSASAAPTVWVIMAYADWDRMPTQRIAGNPSAPVVVRRSA